MFSNMEVQKMNQMCTSSYHIQMKGRKNNVLLHIFLLAGFTPCVNEFQLGSYWIGGIKFME